MNKQHGSHSQQAGRQCKDFGQLFPSLPCRFQRFSLKKSITAQDRKITCRHMTSCKNLSPEGLATHSSLEASLRLDHLLSFRLLQKLCSTQHTFSKDRELQSGYTDYDPKNVCLKARDSRYWQITEEGQGQEESEAISVASL